MLRWWGGSSGQRRKQSSCAVVRSRAVCPVAQKRGDGLWGDCREGFKGEVSSELSFVGPFLECEQSPGLSFFWDGRHWGWGIRLVSVVFVCRFALCFFFVHTLVSLSSPPLCSGILILNLPSFTTCLFNCTHISEDFGREWRIHLLIYVHWESCASEIKILLRLYVLIQLTQRELCDLK